MLSGFSPRQRCLRAYLNRLVRNRRGRRQASHTPRMWHPAGATRCLPQAGNQSYVRPISVRT